MLKIIIDEHIAFAESAFAEFGEIQLLPAEKITPEKLADADALIVRSTVKVDRHLLQNSAVQFVGTATIGTDHVEASFLNEAGIAFASAAGCNADAVAEYVFTAIAMQAINRGLIISESTLGIVGVGNVGSRVERLARACGLRVLKNDPPLQRLNKGTEFVDLREVLEADILTLHVPLTMSGEDKTCHLFDEHKLSVLQKDVLLINAARGAVIDNQALLAWKKARPQAGLVLDVWENEPAIDSDLLDNTNLPTPHIAGYSLEGKANGTKIIYEAFCRHFGLAADWQPQLPAVAAPLRRVRGDAGIEIALFEALSPLGNLKNTDENLRQLNELPANEQPKFFQHQRKTYPLRREFFNYTLRLEPMDINLALMLNAFRFQIESSAV